MFTNKSTNNICFGVEQRDLWWNNKSAQFCFNLFQKVYMIANLNFDEKFRLFIFFSTVNKTQLQSWLLLIFMNLTGWKTFLKKQNFLKS